MEPAFLVLFMMAVIVVVGCAAYYHHQKEKERRESLQKLAAQLRWRFDSARDYSHDSEYSHFELFRRGHGRAAYNTLTGSLMVMGRQCETKMGDFTYKVTSGSGKSRTTRTYNFSYLIIHLPMRIPALIIRPEGMFDRVAGFFGFGSISFESAEFNRLFYVSGDDKKFAYDVIHPQMMEFLLHTRPPAVDIELGRMCLSDGSRRWQPEEFRKEIAWVDQFFSHWPPHIKADLESRAAI